MNYLIWMKGLLSHSGWRLRGEIAGVALTVALLISIGIFLVDSDAKMTQRAIGDVPVDWQIRLTHPSDVAKARDAVGATTPYTALSEVDYADSAGFLATTGTTTQTTGAGKILGVESDYFKLFPKELRPLLGSSTGVLIAQQTAANLHVRVGDQVTINRIGLPPVMTKVDGVVDLPEADSLFQAIGLPPNAAPQAPPDNVLIVPNGLWHAWFDSQRDVRPDSVAVQIHAQISHQLPHDPNAAYLRVQEMANHVEALIAGSGTIGNNLAARLDGVREDALYSRVLFLFLGLPGVLLAAMLTIAVSSSGEQLCIARLALLQTRGASLAQMMKFAAAEALLTGIGGVILGTVLAYLASVYICHVRLVWTPTSVMWAAAAMLAGVALSFFAVLYPAWRRARYLTVATAKAVVGRGGIPYWQRLRLDLFLLTVAAISWWKSASTGYQLVLAPEGVAKTSVHYEVFLAPFCLWLGSALLCIRFWSWSLTKRRSFFIRLVRPLARNLSPIVTGFISRQRRLLIRGILLTTLAFSFAASTAIFNTTYNGQAIVDARLTNGSDVTVSGPQGTNPGSKLSALDALPGVAAAQAMQHRFAYVGNDLQDLFGIDPLKIGQVTSISDAYFANGHAKTILSELASQKDGVLVSEETVKDYQLKPRDTLKLRLLGSDHHYHVIPFKFIGIVREFPTAPKDSFLVANAGYVAEKTGVLASETVLIRAQRSPTQVAGAVEQVVSDLAGVHVTDIGTTEQAISSSLTSVNLRGLTRLELVFAVIFIAATTGLILALGMNERKRTNVILTALGANRRQLGAFLWSESLLTLLGGGLVGFGIGYALSMLLVQVLTGVFDPPPEYLKVPWFYLVLLAGIGIIATYSAVSFAERVSRRSAIEALRGS